MLGVLPLGVIWCYLKHFSFFLLFRKRPFSIPIHWKYFGNRSTILWSNPKPLYFIRNFIGSKSIKGHFTYLGNSLKLSHRIEGAFFNIRKWAVFLCQNPFCYSKNRYQSIKVMPVKNYVYSFTTDLIIPPMHLNHL